MISSVHGRVEAIGSEWVVVNVNGMGLQVFVPTGTLSLIGVPGEEVKLYTHLHVREDVLALYGFATFEDVSLFRSLISVSGIGPKLGMAMLSAMKSEQITAAIVGHRLVVAEEITPGFGTDICQDIAVHAPFGQFLYLACSQWH